MHDPYCSLSDYTISDVQKYCNGSILESVTLMDFKRIRRTVSPQETKIFRLNRKEPKLNLFRLFFGLFHGIKKSIIRFFGSEMGG
jgi:hypothetical protein